MIKRQFLRIEYVSLREEIKETKARLFKLAALGIIGMPAAYSTAKINQIDVLVLSLPLLICAILLLYLSESRSLMRCGSYIKQITENNIEDNTEPKVGWEHWLSENDSGITDKRAVDKLIAIFFYFIFAFYYIAASYLSVVLANDKFKIIGLSVSLGIYLAIGIVFIWFLCLNFNASTRT